MKKIFTAKRVIIGIVLLLIGILLYFHLSAFMPFILAIITAFMLDPLVRFFKKNFKFKSRFPAVVIVFVLFVLFMAALLFIIVTKLINETVRFVERIPGYIVEMTAIFDNILEQFNETVAKLPPSIIDAIDKQIENLIDWATEFTQKAIPLLADFVQSIPNLVIVFIVYLISLFLFSLDLPRYKEGFFNLFEEKNAEKVRYMLHRSVKFFTGFFKAQFLVSIIIFIVSYIGLLIITPSNALIMSLIIWFIDFVPFIGSIVILAPWGLFHLIAGNIQLGVELLILAGILLIIRRTVEPKVMGDQIGLPALPTLIGLWLGLYFFGIIGLIVGPLSIIAIYAAKEAGIIKLDFKL